MTRRLTTRSSGRWGSVWAASGRGTVIVAGRSTRSLGVIWTDLREFWTVHRVLEYAIVDSSVQFTGKLHLFHGDTRVGPVPGLAICRDSRMEELLLFHCDENWNVVGGQIWNSPVNRPSRAPTK